MAAGMRRTKHAPAVSTAPCESKSLHLLFRAGCLFLICATFPLGAAYPLPGSVLAHGCWDPVHWLPGSCGLLIGPIHAGETLQADVP